jgi:uncharacterized protein
MVQLVDLPAITEPGIPPWMRALVRQADLVLIVVDLSANPLAELEAILGELGAMRVEPGEAAPDDGEEQPIIRKRILAVANKLDVPGADESLELLAMEQGQAVPILGVSAATGAGLDVLRGTIFDMLGVVRVYTRPPGREADFTKPVILPAGSTVGDLADDIHRDMKQKLKYALLWGSGKFDAQRVSRAHVLADGDLVEFYV